MAMTQREDVVIALCSILYAVVLVVTGARLWTRRFLQNCFGVEDWLVAVAMLASGILCIGCVLAVCVFSYGMHTSELSPLRKVNAAWWLFLAEFVFIATSALIKMSILLFYRRLSDKVRGNMFQYALRAVMAWVIVYRISYLITTLLTCRPLQARWQRENPLWVADHNFVCLSERTNFLIGSNVSATEDLVIAILPTWILWDLQIARRQKIALWCLFALSTLTSVAGYIRSYFIYKAYWGTQDYMYEFYWIWLTSALELSFALICSSAPALKPFFGHFQITQHAENMCKKVTDAVGITMAPAPRKLTANRATYSPSWPRHPSRQLTLQGDDYGFDDYVLSGVSTTTSHAAHATWKSNDICCDDFTEFLKDCRHWSEDWQVADEAHGRSASKPSIRDAMWISVRSSITVQHHDYSDLAELGMSQTKADEPE